MKLPACLFLISCCIQCRQPAPTVETASPRTANVAVKSYAAIKNEIAAQRKSYKSEFLKANPARQKAILKEAGAYWADCIPGNLFSTWQGTKWDFNGAASEPGNGPIACGYFVTTLLRDMGLPINRQKLSTCASSQMMKALTPNQPLTNASYKSYDDFTKGLQSAGKAVYIIGLDFHTGFIVNDGQETWFIHSNYINRRGVTKEPVSTAAALHASKTRWLVSLTGDKDFITSWLKQ